MIRAPFPFPSPRFWIQKSWPGRDWTTLCGSDSFFEVRAEVLRLRATATASESVRVWDLDLGQEVPVTD